jgi:hypothetical protein
MNGTDRKVQALMFFLLLLMMMMMITTTTTYGTGIPKEISSIFPCRSLARPSPLVLSSDRLGVQAPDNRRVCSIGGDDYRQGKTSALEEKPTSVALHLPQISHGPAWD